MRVRLLTLLEIALLTRSTALLRLLVDARKIGHASKDLSIRERI
jgi:hypothetical protein